VVRYPTTDKVAIENDGDIELNTGTVASAKVLTTADIFVDGSTEGLLAQLTSVIARVNLLETKLAALEMERPLSADAILDTFDTADCDLQGWSGYVRRRNIYYGLSAFTKVDQPRCHPCGDLGYMLGGIYERGYISDYSASQGIASMHILTFVEKTYTSLPSHSALRMTFGLTIINPMDADSYGDADRRTVVYYPPEVWVDGRVVFEDDFEVAFARGEIPCLGTDGECVKHCSTGVGAFNYERTVTVLHHMDDATIEVSAMTNQVGYGDWQKDYSWGLRYVSVEPVFL
jgi:hypothetical protein